MSGEFYAYDAYVPAEECPWIDPCDTTTSLISDGKGPHGRYYRFDVATRPKEHWAMEKGWDRYQAALAHEKASAIKALELAKAVYPELAGAAKWTELWMEIPGFDQRHATKWTEVS